jgi:homoserine kinase type II
MAVYTPVDPADAQALFDRLQLGAIGHLQPASSGIENTNYIVQAESGPWVLTVFERLRADQLPFYLSLMQHLARRGLPVPEPQAQADGSLVHRLSGKPAAVVPCLPGEHDDAPDLDQIRQLGSLLARLHREAMDTPLKQDHLRGLGWWRETTPVVLAYLQGGDAALLSSELAFLERAASTPAWQALPQGPIHADLFRDNTLFVTQAGSKEGPQLSAVLDFYFAGVDRWLFDIAVCLNDWCTDASSGRLTPAAAETLVAAYNAERPLTAGEWRLMPTMLRAAAFRFWLSRLWDWHLPRQAAVLTPKDPKPLERILRAHIDEPWHPETL